MDCWRDYGPELELYIRSINSLKTRLYDYSYIAREFKMNPDYKKRNAFLNHNIRSNHESLAG